MGNEPSSSRGGSRRKKGEEETATDRARKVVGEVAHSIQKSARKLENGVASSDLIDNICGPLFEEKHIRNNRSYMSSAYSEEYSEEDTMFSETDTMDSSRYDRRSSSKKDAYSAESASIQSDYESDHHRKQRKSKSKRGVSEDTESLESMDHDTLDTTEHANSEAAVSTTLSKPLASSFAKRCYFTKAGIGKTTQHYEGLTLTGNIVLMLAQAMKLKGCPTICDEDLRRVEQTYPNQFSRLPDELLLSSGWRRISKYCHFSNKPIPDGIPFFHSRERIHPSGGYYFLLAAAVGMIRPIDVEPLTRDTLVLLETDFPTQCDAAAPELIQDPTLWTLVDRFCFFSGGPINAEEDVYYQADFDGNAIFMLAFLSPSLTPEELYKLGNNGEQEESIKTMAEVQQVESVYDLTERDFDDLKLYHLGPCRALPQYILQPNAWTKVLPPHFLVAKDEAMRRAHDYEVAHGGGGQPMPPPPPQQHGAPPSEQGSAFPSEYNQQQQQAQWGTGWQPQPQQQPQPFEPFQPGMAQPQQLFEPFPPPNDEQQQKQFAAGAPVYYNERASTVTHDSITYEQNNFQREVEEEGAFVSATSEAPIDEALASRARLPPKTADRKVVPPPPPPPANASRLDPPETLDPPEDEPPSLSRRTDESGEEFHESFSGDDKYYGNEQQSYENNNNNSNNYAAEGEYYDSPEKTNDGGGTYYTREEEYYDSPENIPPNAEYQQQQQQQDGYYEQPEKPNKNSPPYYDAAMSPQPPAENGEYYGEVETEKKTSDDPNYGKGSPDGGGGTSNNNNDEYYEEGGSSFRPQESGESWTRGNSASYSGELYEGGSGADYTNPSSTSQTEESGFEPIVPDSHSASFASQSNVTSPTSQASGRTTPSSAMRGAHELIRRNRMKRQEELTKQEEKAASAPAPAEEPEKTKKDPEPSPPRKQYDEAANNAWDTASEMTSVVSSSSVWTDASNADRSSRRALILQMAKARMKSNKHKEEQHTPAPIAEESVDESSKNPTEVSIASGDLD